MIYLRTVLLLTVVGLVKCGEYDDDCYKQTVVTFNVALNSVIPLYESRKYQTASALAEINADVLCIQEITMICLRTILLLTGVGLVTCGEYEDDCCKQTMVTFNVALNPVIPLYESRKYQTASALAEINADVLCIQEITYEEDMTRILEDLEWIYPFSWSFLHSTVVTSWEVYKSRKLGSFFQLLGEKPFPCDDPAFPAFQQCLAEKCSSASGGIGLSLCSIASCSAEYFALEVDCISCLAYSASSLQDLVSKCVTPKEGRNRFNSEDILVLSKKPIISARKIQFHPGITQVFPRGILEVNIPGTGKVACTHLTADLTDAGLPYYEAKLTEELGITSFAEQQAREVTKIEELYHGNNVIVAGDLNMGPAVPSQNVQAAIPQNYAALIAQGFDSPYADQVGKCTFCSENTITFVNKNILLDHILFSGQTIADVSREYDNATNPLSDHYGVSVTFCMADD